MRSRKGHRRVTSRSDLRRSAEAQPNHCVQLSLDPRTTPALAGAAPASSATDAQRYAAAIELEIQ